MNFQYLRYAIEVDKAGSISKAAESLCMNQPNLSKAIKELESSIGVSLFARTTKGISATTEDGRVFIEYAKKILAQVEEMETHFHSPKMAALRVAMPRAEYVKEAVIRFAGKLDGEEGFRVHFQEANPLQAIESVAQDGYHLAVVRYPIAHEKYFRALFRERGLERRKILEADGVVLLSEKDALAHQAIVELSDLETMTELVNDDFWIPAHLQFHQPEIVFAASGRKQLFVSERASQLRLLTEISRSFMWSCPMSKTALSEHGLVQKICNGKDTAFKDVLICRRGYALSGLEQLFVEQIDKAKKLIAPVKRPALEPEQ